VAGTDLVALEENPFQSHRLDPVGRRHGDRFRLLRGGLDVVPVTIVVRGVEDRTTSPMVVNIDTGSGVATTVTVSDGQDLRFERDGRVVRGADDVTARSFAFVGGVYADEDAEHFKDFVWGDAEAPERFGDRAGTFAVTHPVADAFDDVPTLPHADGRLPAAMDRGESRWAFFIGEGRFAGPRPGAGDEAVLAAPRPLAGFYDESVFEPDPSGPPSALVGLEWDEREPFAVRLWLPMRLSTLDRPDEVPVRERLRTLLDRHRPAGVHAYVAYADPRWTLGSGVLRDLDSSEPLGVVVAGTTTWEPPT
jgi:hypothetical protein